MVCASGCIGEPEPGEYGLFRYVGNVRGEAPLNLLPPISDRDGNAYVLYGNLDLLEVELFVGGSSGGWRGGCTVTFGNDFGVHGFVGRSQGQAWYWSGDALVGVFGGGGECYRVLEFDPTSGTRLAFRAVVPWVRETPSRLTTLAYLQSPTDALPYVAVIDLDRNIYTNIERFDPKSAANVEILGVGGNRSDGEGVVVVRYQLGEATRTEARFYDFDGNEIESVDLSGLDAIGPYGYVGFIQSDDQGLYAGLDNIGNVTLFDKSGGSIEGVGGMIPAGIHSWEGRLYVVGSDNGVPKIAPIDTAGNIGSTRKWNAAVAAQDNLGGEIDVVDDRSLPSRDVTWNDPRSAMGPNIFVHSHPLDHYADGTTTWLFAGPSFDAGGEPRTAIAYVPVGIRYEEE